MEHAKERIRSTLNRVKGILNQEPPRTLREADTKANFIEPIIDALGWSDISSVTREYYVRDSQEFIDYVMFGSEGHLLAIEAKALQADLTEKNAAQLVQYCAVAGIEWAALTNGRELQFFNTFLKPDLPAKRIFTIDLLAFNTDEEFDALFEQIWRLSHESMTTPSGVRSWLNQWTLDKELRVILLNPNSATIRQLRRTLEEADVRATAQDLTRWFGSRLTAPAAEPPPVPPVGPRPQPPDEDRSQPAGTNTLPTASLDRLKDTIGERLSLAFQQAVSGRWSDTRWRATRYYVAGESNSRTFVAYHVRRTWLTVDLTLPDDVQDERLLPNATKSQSLRTMHVVHVRDEGEIDDGLLALIGAARTDALSEEHAHAFYGVTLSDLIAADLLKPGTPLVLSAGGRELATASLTDDGQILNNGVRFSSPSNRTFAALMGPGRISLNGWTHWFAVLPNGQVRLADIREQYVLSQKEKQNNS